MLCKAFSFHAIFHGMKTCFDDCTATIEIAFHLPQKLEKLQRFQTL